MKLAVASGIIHPEPGGPATYLHRVLPELMARGWQVRVVSYSDDAPPPEPLPYPVERVPRRSLPVRLFDYARAARPLLAWADVVYLHTLGLPLTPVGGRRAPRIAKIVGDPGWERAMRKGWIPTSLTVDAYQTADLLPIAAADRAARTREARGLDAVIVPSAYLGRMVIGWGVKPERVQVIYNTPPPSPPLTLSRADARAAFGIPDDGAPVLVYVGRLAAWKGVDTAIEAVRRLRDARLLIAGDGAGMEALRARAAGLSDRVRFLGRVSGAGTPLLMRAADYLLLYSGYEGLSHTLLEALHVGTPVIASDQGGNPEVIAHDTNGLLVPYAPDPVIGAEALYAALLEGLRPGVRDRLAAGAHIDHARFSFDRMIEQTDAALRRFIRPSVEGKHVERD
jgi:glycosyltransferase involved in cell wall biosynthesis